MKKEISNLLERKHIEKDAVQRLTKKFLVYLPKPIANGLGLGIYPV